MVPLLFYDDKKIIDFGLIQPHSSKYVISTSYITSPESLLTLDKYSGNS